MTFICTHAGRAKCLIECGHRRPHKMVLNCSSVGPCFDSTGIRYARVECVPVDSPRGLAAIKRVAEEVTP